MDGIASAYDAMGRVYTNTTQEARLGTFNAPVRHLNNGVKAILIDAACRTVHADGQTSLHVVDIAGGRGQDVPKWMYGASAAGCTLASYVGLDLAKADVDAMSIMAHKHLPGVACATHVHNAGTDDVPAGTGTATVVSCQLAVHYLCAHLEWVDHFFSEVARVLQPHGLVVVSYTDGEGVIRRARHAAALGPRDAANLRVSGKYYVLDVPGELAGLWGPTSPWGSRCTFTMRGSVEDTAHGGIQEPLCFPDALHRVADSRGLTLVLSATFDQLGALATTALWYQTILSRMRDPGAWEDPDARDTANLYRCSVFCKRTWLQGPGMFASALYHPQHAREPPPE